MSVFLKSIFKANYFAVRRNFQALSTRILEVLFLKDKKVLSGSFNTV